MAFQGRVAVVTGTSSGIGSAVARQLLAAGALVFGFDTAAPTVDGLQPVACDVAEEGEVERALAEVGAQTAVVDHLVNVVGVLGRGERTPVYRQDLADWNSVLQTNLTSMLAMIKHAFPLLAGSRHGSIVNISSDQAVRGRRLSAPYAVSKAGVEALTRLAALELAEHGIRANAVAPGTVRTNFLKSLIGDEERIDRLYRRADEVLPFGVSEPEDVAALVLFLLSDQARRITGEVVRADGGQELLGVTL